MIRHFGYLKREIGEDGRVFDSTIIGQETRGATQSVGTHPEGMKEGSRGSKHGETPGQCGMLLHPGGMPEGRSHQGRVRFWQPVPGCRTLAADDRGSPLRSDPRLPSANPPGCSAEPGPDVKGGCLY